MGMFLGEKGKGRAAPIARSPEIKILAQAVPLKIQPPRR